MEYNGAAIIAMAGKNCVGIARSVRINIGTYLTGLYSRIDSKMTYELAITHKTHSFKSVIVAWESTSRPLPPTFRKSLEWDLKFVLDCLAWLQMCSQCMWHLLPVFPQHLHTPIHVHSHVFSNRRDQLQFRLKLYKLREKRDISAQAFSHLVSGMLYEKRFSPYFVEPVIAGLTSDNKPYLCATDLIGFDTWDTYFGEIALFSCMFSLAQSPLFRERFCTSWQLRG